MATAANSGSNQRFEILSIKTHYSAGSSACRFKVKVVSNSGQTPDLDGKKEFLAKAYLCSRPLPETGWHKHLKITFKVRANDELTARGILLTQVRWGEFFPDLRQ